MNGRERILTALSGGAPDRVPRALGFRPVDLERTVPAEAMASDVVDVQFVRMPLSAADEDLRRLGRPYEPDTRLGTFEQVAAYRSWRYRPETPERRNPLAGARSIDDLSRFPFPDASAPYHVAGLADQVRELHDRGWAAGGNLPHLGGELFESAWRLRGLENFLLDLVERPDWACFLLDRLTELSCRNTETLARAGVDLFFIDDDVGMPGTMMISPAAWRTFFKSRMARIIEAGRAIRPELRVLFHSDGTYTAILDDLIEIGVNGINPLQPEHMDAERIRRRYGPTLALWGTVGRQTALSSAAPEDIRREVAHRVRTLGRAGLVLSPAYDMGEPDTRSENIAAFLDAARAYG